MQADLNPTDKNTPTKRQRFAQVALQKIVQRKTMGNFSDYITFAKKFPALIHACGLVQAIAFAQVKLPEIVEDLAEVMRSAGNLLGEEDLAIMSREANIGKYQRLSRDALDAASWLKRYTEAHSQ